jgi:hypothetical protein
MFSLITEPAPAALAMLGQAVELRELDYGHMRDVMTQAEAPGESAERLLGACLYVDGQPIGYEGLRGVPGRYAGAIATALHRCLVMHGLTAEATDDDDPKP